MPGCKPTDRVVVIAPYHTGPSPVGSFHRVEEPCACLRNWWCVKAEQEVIGVVAVTDDDRAVCTDIGAGDATWTQTGREVDFDGCGTPVIGEAFREAYEGEKFTLIPLTLPPASPTPPTGTSQGEGTS